MSRNAQSGRPTEEDDRSRNQAVGRGTDSPDKVAQDAAGIPQLRGAAVVVRLPYPRAQTWALLAGMLGLMPPGHARELVASLAAQLADPDAIRRGQVAQTARDLREAWTIVLELEQSERKRKGWTHHHFEREWNRASGDPTASRALPWRWRHDCTALSDAGLPWHVVRDQIHDTLTSSPDPSFAAVMRGCRRSLKRLRQRTERMAGVSTITPREE